MGARFAASMIPGPPPVITAKPASASMEPSLRASAYQAESSCIRAEPKTEIAAPTSASELIPWTNSPWIRRTRQGSVWVKSASSGAWARGVEGTLRLRSCSSSVTLERWPVGAGSGLSLFRFGLILSPPACYSESPFVAVQASNWTGGVLLPRYRDRGPSSVLLAFPGYVTWRMTRPAVVLAV